MIKKERLQELIEQNAIVYQLLCGVIYEYKLNKNYLVGVADGKISLMKICNEYEQDLVDYITNLFETKEDAEWHAEFGRIERTERLELPTWEEMQDKFEKKQIIERYYYYSKHFYKPNRDVNNIDNTYSIYLMPNGLIIIDDNENVITLFHKELTKENYTLACRICKELFLGEKEC